MGKMQGAGVRTGKMQGRECGVPPAFYAPAL